MLLRSWIAGIHLAVVILAGTAYADEKLALILPGVYGPEGLRVDSLALLPSGQTHSAHFNSAFQTEFRQFNVAFASQITSLPAPSPASGFTYTFDSSLGLFTRSTDSFGPILADRGATLGKNKFSAGFAFQYFTFDTLDGIDVKGIPAVFTHDNPARGGRDDVVSTENSIDAKVGQFTVFLDYGIATWLDAALAIPVMSVDLTVTSTSTINRIGTSSNPRVHFFRDSSGAIGSSHVFRSTGQASGIGDLTFRLKGRLLEKGPIVLGLGVDFRAPTGDEQDLLGSGAPGVKPFFVFSTAKKRTSFHLNFGYQWNGKSVLAGDVATGEKAEFPDQLVYAGGVTVAASKRLTFALDVIGQRFLNAPRLSTRTFTALDNVTTLPDVSFGTSSFSETSGSVGLRINAVGGLLINANVLFKLDDNGLRDKATPLVGLEYSF